MTEPEPVPGANREELERAILGETPGLTREAVAEAAGVDLEQARRLWRALGFPDVGDAARSTSTPRCG
jgi:adenylate cyclase